MDAIVIGGGPGGYSAAIRIAQLGGKVVLIEKSKIGGVCTNRGCIPTKALNTCAEFLERIERADKFGLELTVKVDFEGIFKRKDRIVNSSVRGLETVLKSYGVEIVNGKGTIIDKNHVKVNGKVIEAENIIIATGSIPRDLPHLRADGEYILSCNQIIELREIPDSLVVIGGGVMGTEFGAIFHHLGSKVTIIEASPHLLRREDHEISKELERILKGKGIQVLTNSRVTKINTRSKFVEIGDKKIHCDKILLTVGLIPNFNPEELSKVGIDHDKEIKVDCKMRTNIKNIYAVGDVIGGVMYAYVASAQGIVAANNIMGVDTDMDYKLIPKCIFTIPEISSVGLKEEEAKEKYGKIKIGKYPMCANAKARIRGETHGFIKVILEDKTNKIVGVHMIGCRVEELIGEATLALRLGLKVEDVINTLHAHPTLYEAFVEALRNAIGEDLYLPK
jgi:dihydrolipoamide dehydrogenase